MTWPQTILVSIGLAAGLLLLFGLASFLCASAYRSIRPAPVRDAFTDTRSQRKEEVINPEATASDVVAAALTHDQVAFRTALKQFALTQPRKLHDAIMRVENVLLTSIKSIGEQDFWYALHHAHHFAFSAGSQHLLKIVDAASLDILSMNIETIQDEIIMFLNDYLWTMKYLANLNMIAKVDLEEKPEIDNCLAADRDFVYELDRLKVWPEISDRVRSQGTGSLMAANHSNWTTPIKVNWN